MKNFARNISVYVQQVCSENVLFTHCTRSGIHIC